MASITFRNLSKIYANGYVSVNNLSLEVEDGEFVVFHGPSGCGKSAVLRMIGGLEDISSGEIYLGDSCLNDILPRDRKLAMAFQNYVLYSHFNVYENIALGLRLRNMPRGVIHSRVNMAAELLGISDVLQKRIRSISDAQRQKTALCRAIVCHPKVLLVDEDFAQGIELLRRDMLHDIQLINQKLKITVLYVTNKPEEAETLGTKVVYMKDGCVIDVKER